MYYENQVETMAIDAVAHHLSEDISTTCAVLNYRK